MPVRCPDCDVELDHCHDLLVQHADGSVECLGSVECHAEVGRHGWRMTCVEVIGDCGCGG